MLSQSIFSSHNGCVMGGNWFYVIDDSWRDGASYRIILEKGAAMCTHPNSNATPSPNSNFTLCGKTLHLNSNQQTVYNFSFFFNFFLGGGWRYPGSFQNAIWIKDHAALHCIIQLTSGVHQKFADVWQRSREFIPSSSESPESPYPYWNIPGVSQRYL